MPPAPADVRQPAAPPSSWRAKVRHAVDLTVAFVLLEDAPVSEQPRASVDAVHPHRKPLRPMPRPRRPGEAARRSQPCLCAPERTPPKRRARTS